MSMINQAKLVLFFQNNEEHMSEPYREKGTVTNNALWKEDVKVWFMFFFFVFKCKYQMT